MKKFWIAALLGVALAGCQSSGDDGAIVGQSEGDREQNVAATDPGDRNVDTTGGCLESDVLQERMLELVNEIRASVQQCGAVTYPAAPALVWSERIESSALKHSEFMAQSLSLEHIGENGSNFGDRLRDEGYIWRAAAENIAFGSSTPESAIQAWMASDEHCVNLMNNRVTEFAASCADSAGVNAVRYWTQVFALPNR